MDVDQMAEYLSGIEFFAEVAKSTLKQFCKELKVESFDIMESVFEKGDIGDAMYVILEGKVKVHDKEHVYDYLGAGECFGEYSLIDRETRSATITAVEESQVLRIGQDDFLSLMSSDAGFTKGILSVMIRRHRELDVIQEQLAASKKEIELASAKMKGLIDGAMDSIIMFDEKFRIILANPSALKLLENQDVIQRNLLLFLDKAGSEFLQSVISPSKDVKGFPQHQYLNKNLKLIGSLGRESINEGTLSRYGGPDAYYYTLILRNIENRLRAQNTIDLLSSQTAYLEEEIENLTQHYGILAEDPSMISVLNHIEQVAPTNATVLIGGETGTGKELVARAIHQASERRDKPLIRVNCGAIPANLIESELFGHEKGAFTGATSSRKGRFALAHKGTIFLDEIGELPLDLQPKLLRVLQEGEIDPVGSSETIKVDVRIVAATHRDLLDLVKQGKFREDLFYRLNVYPIEIPPLRDRGEDVCLIAQEMLRMMAVEMNKKAYKLNDEDKEQLSSYHWPGNVRELENLIERALILSPAGKIDLKGAFPTATASSSSINKSSTKRIYSSNEWNDLERENILRALKKTAWKISGKNGAASLLKIPPTTLASKIKALGISRPV